MAAFRLFLLALTILMVSVTASAMTKLGLSTGAATFAADLAHPWRRQFYVDLEVNLALITCWIIYRERSRRVGLAFAAATFALGALFTAPYILFAIMRAGGDLRLLLLGSRHADRI